MADLNIFKLLPTGDDTFAEVINKNKYYVDKTSYLKKSSQRMAARYFYLQDLVDLEKPY